MKYIGILCLGIMLSSCHHKTDDMQASLDTIRVNIKQSALIATQAVCITTATEKADMIHAAAAMDRHAMGGPEMARIHKMMGQMPDTTGGSMAMNMQGKQDDQSPTMKLHVALHNAGEEVFNFLESMGENTISCAQATPAVMAAAAAMLREANSHETTAAAGKLDTDATALLNKLGNNEQLAPMRALTLALQAI